MPIGITQAHVDIAESVGKWAAGAEAIEAVRAAEDDPSVLDGWREQWAGFASIALPDSPRFANYKPTHFLVRHAFALALGAAAGAAAALGTLADYEAFVRRELEPEQRAGARLLGLFERAPWLVHLGVTRTGRGARRFVRFARGEAPMRLRSARYPTGR